MQKKPIRLSHQSIQEMQLAAKDKLPPTVYDYLMGGAEAGLTQAKNKTAFESWSLIPKRLQGVTHPSTTVEVFGQKYKLPFGAAPVGMQQLFHQNGEYATSMACNEKGAPCALSTVSNISYAEACKDSKTKPWFQLYPTDNFEVTKALIQKVEDAGAEVIVLTVDVPVLGKRKHNARGLLATPEFAHLRFGNLEGLLRKEDNIHDSQLNWEKLALLKEICKAKLVVKGVMHPDDALRCIEMKIDGIIISNHGGRQMESNYSSIEALAAIKPLLPDDYPVFIDGGIRSATDILKAMILGAKMVFLGRPICYGLAVGGKDGVSHLLELFKTDLVLNMQLMGIQDIRSLDRSQIVKAGLEFKAKLT